MTHTVTVTTRLEYAGTPDEERVVDRVEFACDAPPDADCRRYPDCGCEAFIWDDSGEMDTAGHERLPGRRCWLGDWFDAEGAVYVGDDYDDMRDDHIPAIDRSGEITVRWAHEYPEWEWTAEAARQAGGTAA